MPSAKYAFALSSLSDSNAAPQYFFRRSQRRSRAITENIAMPATIARARATFAAVAARRIRALCFFRAWNFFGSCGLPT